MKRFIRSINASAMRRGQLAMWVEEKAVPVMEVLAQLYLFPNTEYENHWRGELYARWNQVKLLKTGKLPSYDFLYSNTLGLNKKSAYRVMQSMIDKEHELVPKQGYSTSEYLNICEEYFCWICRYFSSVDRILLKGDIYKKLDEMKL